MPQLQSLLESQEDLLGEVQHLRRSATQDREGRHSESRKRHRDRSESPSVSKRGRSDDHHHTRRHHGKIKTSEHVSHHDVKQKKVQVRVQVGI